MITCDEIIEETFPTNLNEKKQPVKREISIFYLMAVSIYFYLIKFQGKQKHLLSFNFTNNKLNEIIY